MSRKFNYFYINYFSITFIYFYLQIKGTAWGTIFAVVAGNLMAAYLKKMFAILPQIYPKDVFRYFS